MGSTPSVKPRALVRGDRVGVIAPASGIRPDMLAAGLAELESMGLRPETRPDITAVDRYTAGSVERRLTELRQMLHDDGIRAIFAARGGYGSGHLLDHLEPDEFRRYPKILCGSSDVTLLLGAAVGAGVTAFHGPMVATAIRQGADGYDRDLFRHLLFDGEAVAFDTSGCTIIRAGQATGPIVGGCLTLVTAAIGTSWEPDTRDAILLLEDNNTRPYQIDRMLTQLRQAGKLSGVRGIVFGEMPGCIQHENQGYTLTEVIDRVLGDFDGPVLSGFPTGHTTKPGAIVPLGVQSELSLADEVTFRLLEPAVVPGTYP